MMLKVIIGTDSGQLLESDTLTEKEGSEIKNFLAIIPLVLLSLFKDDVKGDKDKTRNKYRDQLM